MIITFCGHALFSKSEECEHELLSFLEKIVGDEPADMYLGGYGAFDIFSYECCKKYKKTHPNVSLIFVTPYVIMNNSEERLYFNGRKYDCILYPELEGRPLKYAISYRNRYMVDVADYVIAYIDHDWGGAYQTYKYAKRKKKPLLNLSGKVF